MPRLSKALLREKLAKAGYVLNKGHWATLDRLLKLGDGYVLPEAVVEASRSWGWTGEMTKELRKALK
jgi:hypothetical protein